MWRPTNGLTLSGGMSYNDAKITTDFCKIANPQFDCTLAGADGTANELLAPSGTRLPVTAKFKGNLLARYEFPMGSNEGHVQFGLVYEGSRTTDLRIYERTLLGDLDYYTTFDASFGLKSDRWTAELFAKNLFDERGVVSRGIQCGETVCGDPDGVTASGGKFYNYVIQPRTIGVRLGTKF
jgi:outer membrane receptor protein involved in Fe transport